MKTLTQEYWDTLLSQNFTLKGVGWPNWPESYNKIVYEKSLKGLLKIIDDLENEYNFKIDSTTSSIEVGPGTGFYTNFFKSRGVEKYFGLDISKTSIDNLKKIFPNYEFKCLSIYDDLNIYDERKETYDLACVIDVLLHIVDREKHIQAVDNICKMVKHGGYIITGDTATVYRKTNFSEGSKYNTDVSRHIDYIEQIFEKNNVKLIDIHHREVFLLVKNFDFKYSIFEKFNNMFFYCLNAGLSIFRNNNIIGNMIGYPLSVLDSIIVPLQKYSKNNKFLLFKKL